MKPKFSKPATSDIIQYLVEVKNYTDESAKYFSDRFWHYYESKGWLVGKTPMKDWKAAIRTWELNNKSYGTYQQSNGQPAGNKPGTSASRTQALKDW